MHLNLTKKRFNILDYNVYNNNLKNVKLNNKALSNTKGKTIFYIDHNIPGYGRSSIIERKGLKGYKEVDSVILSDYINQRVDFLKLDVEGAEEFVIEELFEKNKLKLIREMIIEYHHHINEEKDKLSKILYILEQGGFGYQITATSQGYIKKQFQDILIYAYQK